MVIDLVISTVQISHFPLLYFLTFSAILLFYRLGNRAVNFRVAFSAILKVTYILTAVANWLSSIWYTDMFFLRSFYTCRVLTFCQFNKRKVEQPLSNKRPILATFNSGKYYPLGSHFCQYVEIRILSQQKNVLSLSKFKKEAIQPSAMWNGQITSRKVILYSWKTSIYYGWHKTFFPFLLKNLWGKMEKGISEKTDFYQ